MTTLKKTLNAVSDHGENQFASAPQDEVDLAVNNFIRLYDARAAFFTDTFVKKVKEGNRKALAELQQQALPPTPMDLRQEFSKCLKANVSDAHTFSMKQGRHYTMKELKQLVPEWSSIAEMALIKSDPVLADKLMSPVQWNAKSAFEVIFASAMTELKSIKKTRLTNGSFDHHTKWILAPLKQAMEHVKTVNPPGNALIGYGDKISLDEAMLIAKGLEDEFRKVVGGKRP
jgi:hypothetical protein